MAMANVETRNGVRDLPSAQEPLALLRALLLCQVAEQTAHAKNCREIVVGLTGEQDGDSVLDREIAEVAANRAELAVAEARHALSKLDDDTYGTCEHCGDTLPFERLEAIPHSRFCVHCAATLG
jgi:RNA polymerase-binding transcription factor DksA